MTSAEMRLQRERGGSLTDWERVRHKASREKRQQIGPPHPGETLRLDVLPALGLSISAAAVQLGISRSTLSRVLHGRSGISPEIALRIEAWLGIENGGRAELWLSQQSAYDLWHARRAREWVVSPAVGGELV